MWRAWPLRCALPQPPTKPREPPHEPPAHKLLALPRSCPSTRRSWRFTSRQVRACYGLNLCPPFSPRTCPSSPGFLLPPSQSFSDLSSHNLPGHFAHGSDRRMVSLEDVFQRFPRMPMSVEVKGENEKLIHKVVLQAGRGVRGGWGTPQGKPNSPSSLFLLLPDSQPGEAL